MREMGLVDERREITSAGYEFMLLDVYDQVWKLAQFYAATHERPECAVRSLFRLSFCEPGAAYAADEDLSRVAGVFASLGLVAWEPPAEGRRSFVPSSLGTFALFKPSPTSAVALRGESSRFTAMQIIVETTFSVYAFTTTRMHIDLLQLFVEVQALLPNVVVGLITRESVVGAVQRGISARHILDFLTQNAHPLARTRIKVIPDNVKDQIFLWESERSRIRQAPGHLYSGFMSREAFDAVLAFCREGKHHVWEDAESMRLFVKRASHDRVREFVRGWRQLWDEAHAAEAVQ